MTLNENGLITLWKRVREYVIWYVTERLKPATSNEYGVIKVGNSLYMDDGKLQQGVRTQAIGSAAHAEGTETHADGDNSHAEGKESVANGDMSHAEGYSTTANGDNSHAEGYSTAASGANSHAEGYNTTASSDESHAEGVATEASGDASHAEGSWSQASGDSSHAEGFQTTASGANSHVEGSGSQASGDSSHAEGIASHAEGAASHAGGVRTLASAEGSFAHGENVSAESPYQTVFGRYNVSDDSDVYAFIIGNGKWRSGSIVPSNAFAVKWNGDIECAGNLPAATSSKRGGVKPDGTTITVDDDGTIHGSSGYELPVATRSELGGVKVGQTLLIDSDGTLDVKIYNETIKVMPLGGLYASPAVITNVGSDSITPFGQRPVVLTPDVERVTTSYLDIDGTKALWDRMKAYVGEQITQGDMMDYVLGLFDEIIIVPQGSYNVNDSDSTYYDVSADAHPEIGVTYFLSYEDNKYSAVCERYDSQHYSIDFGIFEFRFLTNASQHSNTFAIVSSVYSGWINCRALTYGQSGASLESDLSIRNYAESNDLYRILDDVLKKVTIIPWTTIDGSGTFTTDDSMGTSYEYALVCDGKCYFDTPTAYSNNRRLEFSLPDNESITAIITDNGTTKTLSVSCTDGGSHQIQLVRFTALDTADLNNNVGGVGFLMRNEYATASRAGVVRVGSGLTVDSNGVLSVDMTNLNEVSF